MRFGVGEWPCIYGRKDRHSPAGARVILERVSKTPSAVKMDMDLIRKLAEVVEMTEEAQDGIPDVKGYSEREVDYHMVLMIEKGLVLGTKDELGALGYERLSWEGHEFLNMARDEDIWEKTKAVVTSKGGSLSFEAVKIALSELTKLAVKGAIAGVQLG